MSENQFPDLQVLKRSFQLIWRFDKRRVLLSTVSIIMGGLMTLAATYFLKKAISGLSASGLPQDISLWYLGLAFVSSLGIVTISTFSAHLYEVMGFRFRSFIEDDINHACVRMPMALLEDPKTYDTLIRARYAGGEKVDAVFRSAVLCLSELLNLCIFTAFMISVNVWVLILLFVVNIPIALSRMHFSKKAILLEQQQTPWKRRSDYLTGLSVDQYVLKEIKTYQTGTYFIRQYNQIRDMLFRQNLALNSIRRKIEWVGNILRNIGWFAAVGTMLWLVKNGKIHFAEMAYLFTLLPQIFRMINSVSNHFHSTYSNTLYAQHVFDLLDLKPETEDRVLEIKLSELNDQSIVFRDVCFRYPGQTQDVLKQVNLKLEPGKIVALVGINGSGKTTVIKLLAQLYHPHSGRITMGGADIRHLPINDYLQQFSIIFQDFARYHFSVADNIRLGDIDREKDKAEIMRAGQQAGIHPFIESLEEGYDTLTGRRFDEGIDLSGGQWQKIAIARALYRPSTFIVMDEPTSALDAAAEKTFFEEFKATIGNRGALLISHKLSAVKYADYVYVLDNGSIVEEGIHEDLINKQGQYAWLFDNKP